MTDNHRILRILGRTAAVLLLLLIPLLAYRSFGGPPQSPPKKATDQREANPAPKTEGRSQQAISTLAKLIDQAIAQSDFATARWGVSVISLSDSQVIYSRNADKLFTPASNMKIYTTAVALDLLGADYRWRTSVYSDSPPDANGTISGDLVLYGRGAPDLVSKDEKDNPNSLAELAAALSQRGIRRIRGNVIGDESYFRGEPIGEGWQWNDLQWYFGAEASALSVNGNEVDISITPPNKPNEPPAVSSSDTSGYVRVSNGMAIVKRDERFKLGIHRGLSDNDFRIWGDFPFGAKGYGAQLAVHRPSLWAATLFVDALKGHGITIEGQPQTRDWRVPEAERFDPARSTEQAFVTSKPLSEVVRETNKQSVNLNAELILRTIGRERGQMLSDAEPPGRELGDDEAGTAIVRLWLSRSGISVQGIAIHDGSGLSRLNLVTPESIARLLVSVSRAASGQVFRESLPIAGKDGTLAGRLRPLVDRVAAKTGSLTYDNSLSGYLTSQDGEILAFSIICNDQTSRGSSVRLIDQIVSILADYPAFSSITGQKSRSPSL